MAFAGTTQKCMACDKTVYLVDRLTADNRVYHKACFRCHHCKGTLKKPAVNKASSMFGGTREKCLGCQNTVYPTEKVSVNGTAYHKSCFKCSHGGCVISPSNYIAHEGRLYCKHHHTQLIKEKGNLSQLEGDNNKNK
ncbi:pollen-specific protein SF3-like [Tripterygium wilfordii]|uniref:Pollen-specific protein SF3-like n=1 Tax=Tripterygium wilfordii TaxID=458696 RepID=A0A7J7D2Q0_TRIWF|nr:pollen-specific protein SF3-like [Tripterygium wilfordii]